MKLKNHTVAGRFDWIESELGFVKSEEWLWVMEPGAEHLLATLPSPYADGAFTAGFDLAQLTAAPAAPVLAAFAAGHVDRARHAADAAYLHLLRGEAGKALEVFADLPEGKRESKAARTGLAATAAAAATLRGDDAAAVRGIEEAVASEKAGTRRRNVFPGSGAFVLALLSLIRDPTRENIARLEHLRSLAVKNEVYYPLLDAVIRAERARVGKGSLWEQGRVSPIIDRLCEAQGRDPATISRSAAVILRMCDSEAEAARLQVGASGRPELVGTPEQLVEQVAANAAAGTHELIVPDFNLRPEEAPEVAERFMSEVVAAL